MIQSNHLSVPIEEDVYITMQGAMFIELRVTTNNPPASQPTIVIGTTTVHSLLLRIGYSV